MSHRERYYFFVAMGFIRVIRRRRQPNYSIFHFARCQVSDWWWGHSVLLFFPFFDNFLAFSTIFKFLTIFEVFDNF